jgi:WD40 repeat protein
MTAQNASIGFDIFDGAFQGEEQEDQIINSEFRMWKKNTPYLYDTLICHAIQWPSLSCQWIQGS